MAITIEEAWAKHVGAARTEAYDAGDACIATARILAMAVLEDTYHLAGHFRMNAIGTCLCRACKVRAKIAALGAKDAT